MFNNIFIKNTRYTPDKTIIKKHPIVNMWTIKSVFFDRLYGFGLKIYRQDRSDSVGTFWISRERNDLYECENVQ